MLVYPFTFYAIYGLSKLVPKLSHKITSVHLGFPEKAAVMVALTFLLGVAYLASPTLMVYANTSVPSVSDTYLYFSNSPTVPYQDVNSVVQAMGWLNNVMDVGSCVILQHAYQFWGELYLDKSHSIVTFEVDPNQALNTALAHSLTEFTSCGGTRRSVGTGFLFLKVLLEFRILVVYPFLFMEEQVLVEIEENRPILDEVVLSGAKPFVVVGIPAFNEEQAIARVILEAQKFASVVVVCDDGSTDMTGKIAERLGAHVVRHEYNLGYGAAIKSLFKRALELDADVLVTLDADGQHDPNEIPAVVAPIVHDKADVVIGSRFVRGNETGEMPFYRRVGARLITKIVNGSAKNGVRDAQSGFRAYNRSALERLRVFEEGMGASVEILLGASKQNLRICEVPSSCKYSNGKVATSTKNPLSHGMGVVMSIVRIIVEEKPLKVLGIPGILFLCAGTAFGAWMLRIYAVTHAIVTNIALASLSFVLIGFFMLSTSITLYAISRISRKTNGNK